MKKSFGILMVCLFAFTLGFTQSAPVERNLPQIQPTQCSSADNVRGQTAFNERVADLEEAGMTIQRSQGGCGIWDLTPNQRKNLGNLLLEDLQADEDNGKCILMNSSNEDVPFGLTATVGCVNSLTMEDKSTMNVGMIVSVLVDTNNNTIIFFLLATE